MARALVPEGKYERALDSDVFRDAIESAPVAAFCLNGQGRFVYVNRQACVTLGYTRAELCALHVWEINPDLDPQKWSHLWSRPAIGLSIETVHRRKDGTTLPVEISAKDFETGSGRVRIAFGRDISDAKRADELRAKLEAQLLHAQKMESVGRLAGGVAHDFNNALAVIVGYTELASRRLEADDPVLAYVREIDKAATRARDTTRQLLAFSRKERITPRLVDLNELVGGAKNALSRLIGEDVDLQFVPATNLPRILFDPSQMEQILVNLVVNARDAMSDGGRIVIQTAIARLDETYCRDHVDATPGTYVVLAVTDNGTGISTEARRHIFEPFFTTKETGKGTGLGLAVVYGMVRQHGGSIDVDSQPGRGTTFNLYIPAADGAEVKLEPPPEVAVGSGQGTVLVVEDDSAVRSMTQSMLEALGYTVLGAPTPQEALRLWGSAAVRIDLLISDIVMPEMKGPELRDRMRSMRPDLDVLFISGYASDVLSHGSEPHPHFLQKPFTIRALAQAVRGAIKRPTR